MNKENYENNNEDVIDTRWSDVLNSTDEEADLSEEDTFDSTRIYEAVYHGLRELADRLEPLMNGSPLGVSISFLLLRLNVESLHLAILNHNASEMVAAFKDVIDSFAEFGNKLSESVNNISFWEALQRELKEFTALYDGVEPSGDDADN